MTTIMRDKIINLAQRQVGYKETGTNHTKYAQWFDTTGWQWFNTKKQGAEWCAIFVCWLFAQKETLGKTKAYTFLGMPKNKNDNCAAACPYFWKYLKAKGYHVDKKKGQPGDIIFFNSKCSHVGIIEKVEGNTYHTIEGNKSNQVKRCSYAKSSAAIYGIMHPNWAAVEPKPEPTPAPDPEPLPDPTPDPAPVPTPPTPTPKPKTYPKYKVTAKSGLNVRRGPGKGYGVVKTLKYDTTVTVYEQKNGWGKISKTSSQWVSMAYLKKI